MARGTKRSAPSIGLIGAVIVMVIVLWLSAKNWRSAAPYLKTGDRQTAGELRSEAMPGLDEMNAATDAHSAELRRALAGTDGAGSEDDSP